MTTSSRQTAVAELTTVARMAQDGRADRAVLETVLVYRYGAAPNANGAVAERDQALSPVLAVLREDDPDSVGEAWEAVFDLAARARQAWPLRISWLLDLRALAGRGWLLGTAEAVLRLVAHELQIEEVFVVGEEAAVPAAGGPVVGEQLEMWG